MISSVPVSEASFSQAGTLKLYSEQQPQALIFPDTMGPESTTQVVCSSFGTSKRYALILNRRIGSNRT